MKKDPPAYLLFFQCWHDGVRVMQIYSCYNLHGERDHAMKSSKMTTSRVNISLISAGIITKLILFRANI